MKPYKILLPAIITIALAACSKVLDEKSDQSLVVPTRIAEFQAIFDYPQHNRGGIAEPDQSTDNFWLRDIDFNILDEYDRNLYKWNAGYHIPPDFNCWQRSYKVVYLSNLVIEGLAEIPVNDANRENWNDVMGQALFHRGRTFYMLTTVFGLQYDAATAPELMGIPLRLNSNFNEPSSRATLEASYAQVLQDIKASVRLLPVETIHKIRPSRPAAYALLARIYLTMKDYTKAGLYADSCLQLHSELINFNTLNPAANQPMTKYSKEEIYHSNATLRALASPTYARVDSNLYRSYAVDDLRKTIYFRSNTDGTFRFKGSYEPSSQYFDGLATDEILLIRAECRARQNDVAGAMEDLNTLLVTRWKTGTFVPFTAGSGQEALSIILTERRKELINRTLRWTDIKRLNSEGANIVLKHIVAGVEYTLPPNDLRYAAPIPEDLIQLTGLPQNPR